MLVPAAAVNRNTQPPTNIILTNIDPPHHQPPTNHPPKGTKDRNEPALDARAKDIQDWSDLRSFSLQQPNHFVLQRLRGPPESIDRRWVGFGAAGCDDNVALVFLGGGGGCWIQGSESGALKRWWTFQF